MLKTKTIKTDKATLLLVEMPEGAKFIRIETNQAVVPYGQEVNYEVPATKESYGYEETEGFALPEGNWQLLGRIPVITEEQADKVIDKSIHTGLYAHYVNGIPVNIYCYKESSDSLYSLLQANDIYFENPYKDPGLIPSYELDVYREAQPKVWDKERTYLFIKVD